jgi:hypothetical protein
MTLPRTIGVLTFHRCINYGSYWQARCLVEGLRARGHEAVLLDHQCEEVSRAEWRCAFQPSLPERTERFDLGAYKEKGRKFLQAFQGLPLSRQFPLHEPEAAGHYDAVVVGSDEVWNFRHPWYGSKPVFFGAGLDTGRLISYAASFGNHDAADGIHPHWAAKLERFDHISVRDENARTLVRGALGIDPALVLDPCLQFAEAIPRGPHVGDQPYALVYGHGFPDWLQGAVHRWSRRAGVRLVSIGYRNSFADQQWIEAGPAEFAAAVAGASAVITNFFHGCVFALVNGKPFVSAPSAYRFNKVRDLAAALGAEHRLINEGTPDARYDALLARPIEPEITRTIAAMRQSSEAFLDAALA